MSIGHACVWLCLMRYVQEGVCAQVCWGYVWAIDGLCVLVREFKSVRVQAYACMCELVRASTCKQLECLEKEGTA